MWGNMVSELVCLCRVEVFTWDDLNDCFMTCYNGHMARCSSDVCYGPHRQNLKHSQPEGKRPGRGGWISVDGGDPVSSSAGLRPGQGFRTTQNVFISRRKRLLNPLQCCVLLWKGHTEWPQAWGPDRLSTRQPLQQDHSQAGVNVRSCTLQFRKSVKSWY